MGILNWLGLDLGPEKEPAEMTGENFVRAVGDNRAVLLDVWGPGCAPCVALAPTIRRLAAKYDGQVAVYHLNASRDPRLAQRLKVRGTPTVIAFRQGREVARTVGARPQGYYEELIAAELLPEANRDRPD